MKPLRVLLLCAAVALPQLAMAGLADTSPQGLGIVNAVLKFCTSVDPRDTASFQSEWSSIVGSASTAQVNDLEGNSAYKQAFDATTSLLEKLRASASQDCAVGAAQWKGDKHTPSGKGKDDRSPKERDSGLTKRGSDATRGRDKG